MKMKDILGEDQFLQIELDDEKETVLVDPKTKIRTVVPKDPMKPGAITKDDRGNLMLDPKTKGTVDRGIKPGDKVLVKQ